MGSSKKGSVAYQSRSKRATEVGAKPGKVGCSASCGVAS